jgi:PAS domain S-box-containing protein
MPNDTPMPSVTHADGGRPDDAVAGLSSQSTHSNAAGDLHTFEGAELEALYERSPLGLAVLDAELRFVRINRALAEINGFSPTEHIGRRAWDLVPDLQGAAEPVLRKVLESGEPQSDVLIVGKTPARPGVKRTWREQFYPVRSNDGAIMGVGVICEEITDGERLKRELEQRESQLRLVLNGCNALIGILETDGTLKEVNEPALALSNLERGDVVGRKFWDCHWWTHDPVEQERVKQAVADCATGQLVRYDAVVQKEAGETTWIDFMISPVFGPDGSVEMLVPSAFDISGRKHDERHRELMIDELNHRVKNTLAIVQSMANQTLHGDGDRDAQLVAFRGRLAALAGAMDLLTETEWQLTPIEMVIRKTLMAAAAPPDRLTLSGAPINVPAKAAVSIAMAFHELATNAIKYGAWSTDSGHVSIAWSEREGIANGLELTWQEHGGPTVDAPTRQGFGSRMIERVLSAEINGEAKLDFDAAGVRCTISGVLPVQVPEGHHN